MKKHISQYVDRVMQLLSVGNGSIAVITNLLQKDGCSPNDVRPCIYGACAYIVQSNLLTEQQTIEKDAPTYSKDDIIRAFNTLCPELDKQETENIYNFMLRKQWLSEKNGNVYCLTRMAINQPLYLDNDNQM